MGALFVSHSSKDNEAAREVQAWLLQNGYGPVFVDFDREDGLVGGEAWEPQLSRWLERARVFVALVSEHWLASPACRDEWTIARHEGKPVLVLLVGPCTLPESLARLHYIDLTGRAPEAWLRLARALEEAGASPTLFRPHPARPPFPGLPAFDVDDAGVYFGRETEVASVLERLGRVRRAPRRLFAIAGPSGTGKSSLLRAGVLARLRRRPSEWLPLLPLRPGQGMEQGVLRPLEESCAAWYGAPRPRSALRALVEAADPERFAAFFRELAPDPRAVPLLPIDQGEELLSAEAGAGEAPEIARALAGLLRDDGPLLGVVTVRSDLLGVLQRHPLLGPLLADDVYALPPMPRQRYALLIDGPMAQYARHVRPGAEVEPALRDVLVATAEGADALPLVAFTLGALWEEHGAESGRLTLAQLERLGGVGGAVAAVAEKVLDEAGRSPVGFDPEALRRAFVPGLAGATGGGEIVRRRARTDDLPPDALPVLDAFVRARLLVRDEGPDGGAHLEIAHEALLRQWPRLVEWLAQDLDALRTLDRLERAAAAWEQAGRDPELLAHRGETLARAVEAARALLFEQRFTGAERGPLRSYLEACEALEREALARRLASEVTLAAAYLERARREADQLRFPHAAALLAASLHANPYTRSAAEVARVCDPGVAARARGLAWRARSELREALARAPFALERAVAVGRSLVQTRLVFDPERPVLFAFDPSGAREIDLAVGEVRPAAGGADRHVLDVSFDDDTALLAGKGEVLLARFRTGEVLHAVRLPEGKPGYGVKGCLLPGGRDAVVADLDACWHVSFATGEAVDLMPRLARSGQPVLLNALARGRYAAAVAGADSIFVLRFLDLHLSQYYTGQHLAIDAAAFDEVGNQLVFGGVGKAVQSLELPDGEVRPIGAHQDAVRSVTVLSAARLALSTGWDGRVLLWDLRRRERVLELATGTSLLRGSAASPDERRIAVADDEGRVSVWVRREQPADAVLAHGNTVMGVAYSPVAPGRLVSAGFVGETCAALWRRAPDGWSRRELGPRVPWRGVAMAPRGDAFALCGGLPEVHVFDADGAPAGVFPSEGEFGDDDDAPRSRRREGLGFVRNVSFSHDSRYVGWVAPTGRVQVADRETGAVATCADGAGERYSTVAFSPVEAALAAVTSEGEVVWRDADGRWRRLLEGASETSTFGRGVPVAFSPDGRRLAVATGSSGITIVSVDDPEDRLVLEGHAETFVRNWKESVGALAFDPAGSFLVSAGSRQSGGRDPRTVRLWDLRTGDPLLRVVVDGDCLAASVDPFGETICVGCGDRLLLLPIERWLLSDDTGAIQERMERLLGSRAEELL